MQSTKCTEGPGPHHVEVGENVAKYVMEEVYAYVIEMEPYAHCIKLNFFQYTAKNFGVSVCA